MVRSAKYTKKKKTITSKKATQLPDKYENNFLARLDQRTQLAQVLTAQRQTIFDDLGGADSLSHIQKTLVERYVFLAALISKLEVDIATGGTKKNDAIPRWIQALNALTGIAKTLGIHRKKAQSLWKDHGELLDAEVEEVA